MSRIIDGNSIGYAAQNTRKLTNDGMEVQAVYQSLRTLKSIRYQKSSFGDDIWLWDGIAKFRYDEYPDYKGTRDNDPKMKEMREAYKEARPILSKGLELLGVRQVTAPNFEADDVAGFLVRRAAAKNKPCLLITGDRDWLQLVQSNPSIEWHDPRKQPGRSCTFKTFKSQTGFEAATQFLEAKAIEGDKSDNIEGVMGLGPKACEAIMQTYGGVRELAKVYRAQGEFTKENIPKTLSRYRNPLNRFLKEDVKTFTRNYRLMNLLTAERDEMIKSDISVVKGKKDMTAFKEYCHDLNFLSIVREIDKWEALF